MPGQSQQSTTQSPWMTSATDASRGRQPLTQAGDVSRWRKQVTSAMAQQRLTWMTSSMTSASTWSAWGARDGEWRRMGARDRVWRRVGARDLKRQRVERVINRTETFIGAWGHVRSPTALRLSQFCRSAQDDLCDTFKTVIEAMFVAVMQTAVVCAVWNSLTTAAAGPEPKDGGCRSGT